MLFFISLFIVCVSSYMIACVCAPKNSEGELYGPSPFLYTLLTIFAQVVVSFEFMSLFKAINTTNTFILNILFLCAAVFLWIKKDKPVYVPDFKGTMVKITAALKKDKILMIMALGFVFMLATAVILDIFMPVSSGDALAYHLNRSSYWLHQGSLNHFMITDDRNLVMPINSEILYLWNIMFFKGDFGLFLISLIGYIAAIFSIYNILEFFNFSKRRILWTIFIVSSFASVMVEISSLETDILIAGLVLSCITLYLYALKDKKAGMLCFAALAYALAMGTKTPAVIAFPAVFLLLAFFSYRECKKEFYKPVLAFSGFLVINFLIFSSYNYFLNLADFGNPLGSEASRVVHGFRGGFKAFVANYIKYIFMLFDFSGFKYSEYVGEHILNAREAILNFLHIPMDLGVEMSDHNELNNRLTNVKTGAGILGFLLFLPSIVTGVILGVVKKHSKKITAVSAFAWMFLINLACLSFSIAYMVFSVRFLTFLIVISSPILVLSYMKKTNPVKLLVLFFVMSYFLIISVNLAGRQFRDVIFTFLQQPTIHQAREKIRCALYVGYEGKNVYCYMREYIQALPQGSKIALLPDATDTTYILDIMNSNGYNITTLLPELAPTYDFSKYDYVFTTKQILTSTLLLKKTAETKTEYKIAPDGNAYYPKYRPFSCVYEKHGGGFYTSDQKDAVIMDSRCYIDKKFFLNKGYTIKAVYSFESENPYWEKYVTIYQNTHTKN